jgi:hypothetical protein
MHSLCKRRLLLTVSLVEGDTAGVTVIPQKAPGTKDNARITLFGNQQHAEEPTAEVSSPWRNRPHTLGKPFTQRKFTAIVPLVCS